MRERSATRNVFVVAGVILVVALIGLGIFQWRNGEPIPPLEPTETTEAEPAPPTPQEPEWCPAVEFVSVPVSYTHLTLPTNREV